MSVFSPELDSIQLIFKGNLQFEDLRVIYSDQGVLLSPSNNLCECLVQPSGPGQLADFAETDPRGDWLLSMNSFESATLNEWCIAVFPTVLPEADGAPRFLRGDVDNNGEVSGLADGLRLLKWGAGDAPEPPCMEAADADNSGSVSAIPDGLRLLTFQFGGALPPPDPGVEECGVDPEGGNAGCETPPEACN